MARNQYQDKNNLDHNVNAGELYHANGNAIEQKKEFVAYRIVEFDSAGKVNVDGCLPTPSGTTNVQEVTRLMSFGYTDQHGHKVGSPAAIQVLVDSLESPSNVDTSDPNGNWEWASDYLAVKD